MDGFKRPNRNQARPTGALSPATAQPQPGRKPQVQSRPQPQARLESPGVVPDPPLQQDPVDPVKKPRNKKRLALVIGAGIALVVGVIVAGALWYVSALKPVSGETERSLVTIESGSTPAVIASQLKKEGLIRSERAFLWYTRQQGVQGKLQAGTYRLAPSDSVKDIVSHLLEGKAATFAITFYPGGTLFDPTDIADERRTDVYTMLRRAGYTDSEVRVGFEKQYDHPLFAGKPATASLEGYVFGETYHFDNGATVEQILQHTFDIFYERIQSAKILEKLASVDMTLYEAITLASVVEREVSGQLEDQRIVSQIFHSRLAADEPLGADATFMYVAQQRNETPTITIESPYNTRVNKGLPPGPIAAPDIVALEAAVSPADTDYMFFVSGDDGRNHFARTNAEHVENTRRYCTTLCNEVAQ